MRLIQHDGIKVRNLTDNSSHNISSDRDKVNAIDHKMMIDDNVQMNRTIRMLFSACVC